MHLEIPIINVWKWQAWLTTTTCTKPADFFRNNRRETPPLLRRDHPAQEPVPAASLHPPRALQPARGILLLHVPIHPAQDPSPEDSIAHQPLPRQEELLAVLCVRLRADSRTAALPCAGQHWCNPGWIKPKAWVSGKWDRETRQSGQGTAELQIELSQGTGEGFSSLPRPTSLPAHTQGDSS